MRLEARPLSCKVSVPPLPPLGGAPVCVSLQEARQPVFVSAVAREARLTAVLVAAIDARRIALRLAAAARPEFLRQLTSSLGDAPSVMAAVRRAVSLMVTRRAPPPEKAPAVGGAPWYRRWWIWAVVGATATALTATAVVVATRTDRVTVVFDP